MKTLIKKHTLCILGKGDTSSMFSKKKLFLPTFSSKNERILSILKWEHNFHIKEKTQSQYEISYIKGYRFPWRLKTNHSKRKFC